MNKCANCGKLFMNQKLNSRGYCEACENAIARKKSIERWKTQTAKESIENSGKEVMPSEEYTVEECDDRKIDIWMYILSILLPPIGLVMGLIYLGRREDEKSKKLLITSAVAMFVYVFIWLVMVF